MIYNENGMIITNRKSIVCIGEETIDLSNFDFTLHEAAPYQTDKFKKIMSDIRKDIEACDNENINRQKDQGAFFSEKIRKVMYNISMIITLFATGTLLGSLEVKSILLAAISALVILVGGLLLFISSKPSKEKHLLNVAEEAVKYLDKVASNASLPEDAREKAMAQARRLMVKVNKCKEALKGNRWFDQYDWGIASDIFFQNRMLYFSSDITNTSYEENKEKWDNIVRQMNNAFPKALNDIAKRIKKEYSNNENISKLSEKDIANALACYSATMIIAGPRISIVALCCEKDAINSNLKGIPVVLGRVIKIDLKYIDGKITWEYYDTNMKSYE